MGSCGLGCCVIGFISCVCGMLMFYCIEGVNVL